MNNKLTAGKAKMGLTFMCRVRNLVTTPAIIVGLVGASIPVHADPPVTAIPADQVAQVAAALSKVAAANVTTEINNLAPKIAATIASDPSNLTSINTMAAAVISAVSANFTPGSDNYNALQTQVIALLGPQIYQQQDLVPNSQAAKDLAVAQGLSNSVASQALVESYVRSSIGKASPPVALRNWAAVSAIISNDLKLANQPLGGAVANNVRKTMKAEIQSEIDQIAPAATTPAATTPAGTTPAAPTGAAVGTTNGTSNGSTLSSAKVQVGSDLKLVTGNLFSGRIYAFGKLNYLNATLTSSLPATIPNLQTSTEYGDAEIETPDGGLLNLRIGALSSLLQNKGILSYFPKADYFLPNSGVPIYGDRSQSYDRYYFNGGETVDGNPYSELKISTGGVLIYMRDGVDIKLINRGLNSTAPASGSSTITPSSNLGDYGGAAGYYFAMGIDGGLYGQGETLFNTDTPTGTFRLEGLAEYQYTDEESLFNYTTVAANGSTPASTNYGGLYPNYYKLYKTLKNPGPDAVSLGARFVLNITNSLSFDITAMWPMGGERHFMGKTLLGGFTITSPNAGGSDNSTPTPTPTP
jgi:hypothetical protein